MNTFNSPSDTRDNRSKSTSNPSLTFSRILFPPCRVTLFTASRTFMKFDSGFSSTQTAGMQFGSSFVLEMKANVSAKLFSCSNEREYPSCGIGGLVIGFEDGKVGTACRK